MKKLQYLLSSKHLHLLLMTVACLLNVLNSAFAYAAGAASCDPSNPSYREKRIFRQTNDVLYFDECEDVCGSSSSGLSSAAGVGSTPSGPSTSGLTDQQAAFVDKYHDIAEKLSIEYGIPWETVMAQGILESGAGTSGYARERNNFFGSGANTENPDHAYTYATPEEGWEGYYKNAVTTETYRQHGVFQGTAITDPYAYLNVIRPAAQGGAGYAKDENYVAKITPFVKAIEERSKQKGWKSSADLAKEHPEMLTNADANAQGAKTVDGGSSGSGSVSGTSGACSSAAPTGSIAAVATEMGSWGAQYLSCYVYGGGHGKDTAWMKEAIAHHFAGEYAVDCSAFVRAVILQATGSDPGDMTTYTMCDGSNFEHVPRAQAQPGDMAIDCDEHVEVITGVSDGVFSTVGSHKGGCGAGYGASPSNYQGTESFVLRYKG